jgi:hypothetical protein
MVAAFCLATLLPAFAAAESPVADATMRGDAAVVRTLLKQGRMSTPPTATA